MLEDKHQEPVPFDNTFHRQLADVRNSSLNQNHPDVELLNQEHQRNLRHQRVRSVLDSLTGIPAMGVEPLTQPAAEQRPLEVKPKKVEPDLSGLLSFAEVIGLIETTITAGQLTLCVIAFPELLRVRIGLGEEALVRMKASLAERLAQLINGNSCIIGDYADNKLIVLMPTLTKSKAEALLKQVQTILSAEYACCSHARIRTTAQFGVAVCEPGHNWQELLAKADLAVCSTKKKGLSSNVIVDWLQGLFPAKKVRSTKH